MKILSSWSDCVPSVWQNDASACAWLQEEGSMTLRLRSHWAKMQVHVLQEGLMRASEVECALLGIDPQTHCWLRVVCLHQEGVPLLHARTVIPHWAEGNPWHTVARLGARPLGEILFGLPDIEKGKFSYARSSTPQSTGEVPARVRIFKKEGAPLLLTEALDLLAMESVVA